MQRKPGGYRKPTAEQRRKSMIGKDERMVQEQSVHFVVAICPSHAGEAFCHGSLMILSITEENHEKT